MQNKYDIAVNCEQIVEEIREFCKENFDVENPNFDLTLTFRDGKPIISINLPFSYMGDEIERYYTGGFDKLFIKFEEELIRKHNLETAVVEA